MQPNEYEIPEEKLKEWEQAESKATPGPWAGSMCCVTKNNAFVIGCNSCSVHGANHDAKFVALSRNALPLLLKAYRKQREEIERLKEELLGVANDLYAMHTKCLDLEAGL